MSGGVAGSGGSGGDDPGAAGAFAPPPEPGDGEPLPEDKPLPDEEKVPPPDEGGAPLPEDRECTEKATGERYCKLVVTACESDDDCVVGFSCVTSAAVGCAGSAGAGANAGNGAGGDGAGGAGAAGAGAGEENEPSEPEGDRIAPPECMSSEPAPKQCMPPNYVGPDGAGGEGAPTLGGSNEGAPEPGRGEEDDATAEGAAGPDAEEPEESPICAVRAPGRGGGAPGTLFGLSLLGLGLVVRRARERARSRTRN